jgi:NAD(P)H-dependent flavin oxidoreductase YrpB (nitropropane dioxygenase family)
MTFACEFGVNTIHHQLFRSGMQYEKLPRSVAAQSRTGLVGLHNKGTIEFV